MNYQDRLFFKSDSFLLEGVSINYAQSDSQKLLTMLLGICSDTHDHVDHIRKAVKLFKEERVEKVIHAGDYCSPITIPLFDGLNLQFRTLNAS